MPRTVVAVEVPPVGTPVVYAEGGRAKREQLVPERVWKQVRGEPDRKGHFYADWNLALDEWDLIARVPEANRPEW